MTQLSLKMVSRLPYSADNFALHSGVRQAYNDLLSLMKRREFLIAWVTAGSRRGKTHFSIKLSDTLMKENFFPRIIEGSAFEEYLGGDRSRSPGSDEILIVDDADKYFRAVRPGQSGPFVRLTELLRGAGAPVLFLSSERPDQFEFDEHIGSRLNAGFRFGLGDPDESDMEQVIGLMARQRGISLKPSRVSFVAKRVRRDIPSLEEYLNRVDHLSSVLNKSVKLPLLSDAF